MRRMSFVRVFMPVVASQSIPGLTHGTKVCVVFSQAFESVSMALLAVLWDSACVLNTATELQRPPEFGVFPQRAPVSGCPLTALRTAAFRGLALLMENQGPCSQTQHGALW